MEYPDLYCKVPHIKNNAKCYICKQDVFEKVPVRVIIYNDKKRVYKIVTVKLYYCKSCKIAYTDFNLCLNIRMNYDGFHLAPFYILQMSSEQIIDEINTQLIGYRVETNHYKNVNSDLWKQRKDETLFISNLDIEKSCPICKNKTSRYKFEIPISACKSKLIDCYSCRENHKLSLPSQSVKLLLKNNKFATHIKIDFLYFFKNNNSIKEEFYSSPKNLLTIYLKQISKSNSKEMAFIISDENKIINENIHILDYREAQTRRLLTDAFYYKSKKIIYNDTKYNFIKCKKKEEYDDITIEDIILENLQIGNGGGFSHCLRKSYEKIVDVLMFSPYTKCYEISPATYNEEEGYCFMDASLYWRFIRNYGNPNLEVYPVYSEAHFTNDMREESLLHSLGYNVSVKDNLSRIRRRELLANIIDLNLISVKAICDTLNYCIKLHSNEKYEFARVKWTEDMEFVINYVSKPERFMILNYD